MLPKENKGSVTLGGSIVHVLVVVLQHVACRDPESQELVAEVARSGFLKACGSDFKVI